MIAAMLILVLLAINGTLSKGVRKVWMAQGLLRCKGLEQ